MNGTRSIILAVFFIMSTFYPVAAAMGCFLLLMAYLERNPTKESDDGK